PTPYHQLALIYGSVSDIIVDRCYWHGAGYPSRLRQGIYMGGFNLAVIDSDFSNIDYWMAGPKQITDLNPTIRNQTALDISPGTYLMGSKQCNFPKGITVTIQDGASTGVARVYSDFNCEMQVIVPNGIAAECSNCTVTSSSNPAFPVNGSGNAAGG